MSPDHSWRPAASDPNYTVDRDELGTAAVDEVRRRVQQDIHGHRGRKDDPLYRIRNILRAGVEHLTDRQHARLQTAFAADERHLEVEAVSYTHLRAHETV